MGIFPDPRAGCTFPGTHTPTPPPSSPLPSSLLEPTPFCSPSTVGGPSGFLVRTLAVTTSSSSPSRRYHWFALSTRDQEDEGAVAWGGSAAKTKMAAAPGLVAWTAAGRRAGQAH